VNAVALDPMAQAVLDLLGDQPYIDLDRLPPDEALRIARPPAGAASPRPPNAEDRIIAGGSGQPLRVRLYFPDNSGRNKLPVLLHFHGGGFVSGSVELDDRRCARLASDVGCVVVSVEYRLAPEHPFPAALEDGFAAWTWITSDAGEFGGDASRCAISGSSAGGHIAVGVALMARRRGATLPVLQLLAYPVLDPKMSGGSYEEFACGPFLTRSRMSWYWRQYRGAPSDEDSDCWNVPGADLGGLPPAHIITAEYDVLRDEAEAFAARLRSVGIDATIERHGGMIHGFITMLPSHEASEAAMQSSAQALKGAFGAR
jgi:acetyl esterase